MPGEAFAFEHRNRRPPRDAVNCLFSYVYRLLVKDLAVTTNAIGFDPYLGFYHRPRCGRPALSSISPKISARSSVTPSS